MTKIEKYILIILLVLTVIFGIVMYSKCSKLEHENKVLKLEQLTINNMELENKVLKENILSLEDKLIYYQQQLDSLETVKQKVIVRTEYVISENITEGVKLLKENLKCEKY